MQGAATDGPTAPAQASQPAHAVIDRGLGPRGLVAAVVALVAIVAVATVARNRGLDSAGSASPGTSGSTSSLAADTYPGATRPTPSSGSSLPPFETTTTGPALHEISIVPDSLPCKIVGAHETDPDVPDGKEMFTAPTSKPEAMIPGSVSYLSSSDPDFTAQMIPESDYVALWWMGASEKGDNLVGHVDPSTGEFRRSFSMTGCGFRVVGVVAAHSGVDHLWSVVSETASSEYLVDIDLSLGTVVWSARCSRCQELLAGNGVVRVLADPVDVRHVSSGDDSTSGSVELVAVDVASHSLQGTKRLAGSIVPSDDGELWMMAGTVLSRLDATTGAITSYSGSIENSYDRGLVAQRVAVAGGRAWEWTHQGDGELMGYNLDSFAVEHRVPIERYGTTMFAGGRIWTLAANDSPDKDLLLIRAIDPRSGAMIEVARFHTYEAYDGPATVMSTHLPRLSFDATGFWYTDPIPTPARSATPQLGEPAKSDGPKHLMHVNVP